MDSINELTNRQNLFYADDEPIYAPYFLKQVNKDIRAIQDLIAQYNQTNDNNKKRLLLDKIEQKNKIILNKYPANLLAWSADFTEQIETKLFNEIKKERFRLGISSTDKSLARIIENMSPEKISQLMEVLNKGGLFDQNDFTNLYSSSEDGYNNFQDFLNSITQIKFLGGGNSLNFQIKYPTGESLVLKLENRLDQPALIEDHLKSGILKSVIPPIHARRPGTFTYMGGYDVRAFPIPKSPLKTRLYVNINIQRQLIEYAYLDANGNIQHNTIDNTHPKFNSFSGINNTNLRCYLPDLLEITNARGHSLPIKRTINRSLVVSDFCAGGDLELYGKKVAHPDDLILSALPIYIKMGKILTNLTKNNCAFPDMKNTNWLIDNKGTLKIADTKSFIYINKNGKIDHTLPENEWAGLIQSNFLSPPEISKKMSNDVHSADKMHSYMLGKNLYQYLTGCDCSVLDQNKLSFKKESVFQTDIGQQLKSLIKSMVRNNPDDRISTLEALEKLRDIKQEIKAADDLKKEIANTKSNCKSMLEEVRALGFGENDIQMKGFIMTQQMRIRRAHDITDINKIHGDLMSILDKNNVRGVTHLKDYLVSLRKSSSYYLDMTNKYRKIKTAVSAIPIEERANIIKPEREQSDAVKKLTVLLNKYCDPNWLKALYNPQEQANTARISQHYKEKRHESSQIDLVENPLIKPMINRK